MTSAPYEPPVLRAAPGGGCTFCTYHGRSMNPALQEPDVLEITDLRGAAPRIGDVVLAEPPGTTEAVVHRVIRAGPEGLITQGDNSPAPDPWVLPLGCVRGVVTAAWRGSRRRRIRGGAVGLMAAGWRRAFDRAANIATLPARPAYRALVRSGLLRHLLPGRWQPRVAGFGVSRLILMGRRNVGHYDRESASWLIRRPYRLFMDPRSLQQNPIAGNPEAAFIESVLAPARGSGSGEPFLPAPGIDRLLRLATFHGVVSLLHRRLSAADARTVSPELRDRLRDAAMRANAGALRSFLELARLAERLDAAGIRAVSFKGPLLAHEAHGDRCARVSCDLDFLVHPTDLEAAETLLRADGYVNRIELPPHLARAHAKARREVILHHPDRQVQVDLGTGVVPRSFAFDLSMDEVWAQRRPLLVEGHRFQTPGREHGLLLLCVHGSKHLWRQWIGILDVAGLLRDAGPLDWDALMDTARRAGSLRMLAVGLRLGSSAGGVALLPGVEDRLAADPHVSAICRDVLRHLRTGVAAPPALADEIHFHLRCRERRIDRVRYLTRLAFTPSYGDWRSVRLPRALGFLYAVIRPCRLAWQGVFGPAATGSRPAGPAAR